MSFDYDLVAGVTENPCNQRKKKTKDKNECFCVGSGLVEIFEVHFFNGTLPCNIISQLEHCFIHLVCSKFCCMFVVWHKETL